MTPSLVIGALTAMAAASRADAMPAAEASEHVDDCEVAVCLVAVDPTSWVSRMVDRVTGARGFSHVYVDACRQVAGSPVVVDYTVLRGVHLASPDTYASRRVVRIPMLVTEGRELWGCIRSRMGRPWTGPSLVGARESAATCVGLVLTCLPSTMRAELEALREGPCVSPNTLARYWRVT